MPRDFDILLSGFSEAERKAFHQVGHAKDYTLHQMLVQEEELGSSMYTIELGEVSIWMKGVKLARVGAGAVLGASSLIEPHQRTASVMAEDYVRAMIFRREDVLHFFKPRPPRLFQQFFLNSFRAHMSLVRRCNDEIVELERQFRKDGVAS
jgi:CRP-like cAMP-binding protein